MRLTSSMAKQAAAEITRDYELKPPLGTQMVQRIANPDTWESAHWKLGQIYGDEMAASVESAILQVGGRVR
jgi:hypothetical protein